MRVHAQKKAQTPTHAHTHISYKWESRAFVAVLMFARLSQPTTAGVHGFVESLGLPQGRGEANGRELCLCFKRVSPPPVSLPSTHHHHHHLSLWGLLLLLDGDLVLDRFVWRYYFVSSLLLSNAHPLTNMCIPYGEGVPRTVSVDG